MACSEIANFAIAGFRRTSNDIQFNTPYKYIQEIFDTPVLFEQRYCQS